MRRNPLSNPGIPSVLSFSAPDVPRAISLAANLSLTNGAIHRAMYYARGESNI
jgi:hypothetical protein